ncbi:MAG TPA: DUF3043 domain-containing protein [Mycobacteriales bacterium]|nr:DUF3043 domain-containing protein [Mycobacteriales bacterium]
MTDPQREESKGRPTPKRSEARKARRSPSPGGNRKEASAAQRERNRTERKRAYEALRSGDERHLPPRDAGPERRLARDVVDSRFTFGQVFMVLIVAALAASVVLSKSNIAEDVATATSLVAFTVIIVDSARVGRTAKLAVTASFGASPVRGISSYAFLRAMQPRRFRRPPPKVARGGGAIPSKP